MAWMALLLRLHDARHALATATQIISFDKNFIFYAINFQFIKIIPYTSLLKTKYGSQKFTFDL